MGKIKQMMLPLELFHIPTKIEVDPIHPSAPASPDLETQIRFNLKICLKNLNYLKTQMRKY